MAIRLHRAFAVHPGMWLRDEIVSPSGVTVTALAEALGVTRQSASSLLNGKSGIFADMAIRFEKAFGISADTLVRMQAKHDLTQARAHEKDIKARPLIAA